MATLLVAPESSILAAINGPTDLLAGYYAHVNALSYVRVRVALKDTSVAPVVVRPWYWAGGKWYPLRGDGAAGGGAGPVTADMTVKGGRAEGYFFAGGLSHPVAMAVESGDDDDVESCEIEPADANL